MGKKRILVVGLDPAVIDFSAPFFDDKPWINAEVIHAGVARDLEALAGRGHEAESCMIDTGETAEAVMAAALAAQTYDVVVFGAGVRANPEHLLLFERLINRVHSDAPQARIAFNTRPDDTADAALRWT
jgi:hypothetical protein